MAINRAIALQGVGFKAKALASLGYRSSLTTTVKPHQIHFAPFTKAKAFPLAVRANLAIIYVGSTIDCNRTQHFTPSIVLGSFTINARTLAMTDFFIKRNDTLPRIESLLKYSDGKPVSLVGAQQVQFVYKLVRPLGSLSEPNSAVVKIGTILDAQQGKVAYQWLPGDTTTPGQYQAEWRITFAGGGQLTIPNDGTHITIQIVSSLV